MAALADKVKGEEMSVLLTGEFTVTPAKAGRERARQNRRAPQCWEEYISAESFAVENRFAPTRCPLVLQGNHKTLIHERAGLRAHRE